MRVISGTARGLSLTAPHGLHTRPTTDRVKESVFNLLIPYLPCDRVLDLFAGSGALGLEALSRGCGNAVFVEKDKEALSVIHKNLEKARLTSSSEVIKGDAFDFLERATDKFDIIFLDPPYNKGLLAPVFEKVYSKNLLSAAGVIVVESEVGGETVSDTHFDCIKQAKYGKTVISIYGLRS